MYIYQIARGVSPEVSHLHDSGSLNVHIWFSKLLDDSNQDAEWLSNEILITSISLVVNAAKPLSAIKFRTGEQCSKPLVFKNCSNYFL